MKRGPRIGKWASGIPQGTDLHCLLLFPEKAFHVPHPYCPHNQLHRPQGQSPIPPRAQMPGSAGNKYKGDLVMHMRSSSLFNADPQLENAQKERKTLAQRLGGQRSSGHGPKSTRLSCPVKSLRPARPCPPASVPQLSPCSNRIGLRPQPQTQCQNLPEAHSHDLHPSLAGGVFVLNSVLLPGNAGLLRGLLGDGCISPFPPLPVPGKSRIWRFRTTTGEKYLVLRQLE